jgi:RNA polymerase sigma-70 factor (ECF subfamily)
METENRRIDAPTSGDSEAAGDRVVLVKRLFEEHNRTLVNFLHARLHCEQEARDVAQEAYVRLLQLDNHGAIGFLRSYLFRIAENLAVDRLRERRSREAPQVLALFESLVEERAPEREAMAAEELAVVRDAIAKLPDKMRQAFVWHVFGGQSTVDIAARLNMTDRMIRNYIAQGLALCRVRLDRALVIEKESRR